MKPVFSVRRWLPTLDSNIVRVARPAVLYRRYKRWIWKLALFALLLMPLVWGCTAAPIATSVPIQAPTPMPSSPDARDRLISLSTDAPPAIDGRIDEVWATAEALSLPLTWGMEGDEHAMDVELRSLHTDQALYLLAQWPGRALEGPESTVSNLFTVHWRLPDPAAQRLDCTVACHTVFADGTGRLAYANAETHLARMQLTVKLTNKAVHIVGTVQKALEFITYSKHKCGSDDRSKLAIQLSHCFAEPPLQSCPV